jgi:hypothetical protein
VYSTSKTNVLQCGGRPVAGSGERCPSAATHLITLNATLSEGDDYEVARCEYHMRGLVSAALSIRPVL